MRFMLMMHAPKSAGGDYQVSSWSPDDFTAHIQFMHDVNRDLIGAGEFVAGEGLAAPGEARVVRYVKGKAPAVTDGPFPETKEFLAGFWIIDVSDAARAHEIAARISSAPGPGGEPLVIPVEVRQVMSAPASGD